MPKIPKCIESDYNTYRMLEQKREILIEKSQLAKGKEEIARKTQEIKDKVLDMQKQGINDRNINLELKNRLQVLIQHQKQIEKDLDVLLVKEAAFLKKYNLKSIM